MRPSPKKPLTKAETERVYTDHAGLHADFDRLGVLPAPSTLLRLREYLRMQEVAKTAAVAPVEPAAPALTTYVNLPATPIEPPVLLGPPPLPLRVRLPDERQSINHHFVIHTITGDVDGYITVGLYPNGQPGEFFIRIGKGDPALQGHADAWATACSMLLQHGVELVTVTQKFKAWSIEPSGPTSNPEIRYAKSVVDYTARWLCLKFGEPAP